MVEDFIRIECENIERLEGICNWQLFTKLCILVAHKPRFHTLPSDEEVVQNFRNGELNAGGILYTRYKTMIYSFCFRMLNDSELAKDATQETFMKMISNIQSLTANAAFKSWLFSIARNEVLMVVRRNKTIVMEKYDEETMAIWDESTPFTIAAQSELKTVLMNAINLLRPTYREAIVLRDVEGMSYEEIAHVTETTVSAVKSKLFKARLVLNEKLSPYFEERNKQ